MPRIELMPEPIGDHINLLRLLDREYQGLAEKQYKCAPRNGNLPIGGGDWMDSFFRMEAVRGCQGALRRGLSIPQALSEGKVVARISIGIWNKRREWQVRRWEGCIDHYLEGLLTKLQTNG